MKAQQENQSISGKANADQYFSQKGEMASFIPPPFQLKASSPTISSAIQEEEEMVIEETEKTFLPPLIQNRFTQSQDQSAQRHNAFSKPIRPLFPNIQAKFSLHTPPIQREGPDMIFTEKEVHGEGSGPDMIFTEQEVEEIAQDLNQGSNITPEETNNTSESNEQVPLASPLTQENISAARDASHVPEGGLPYLRNGQIRHKDIETNRLRQLRDALQNPDTIQHIRDTLDMFENETDERSHQSREEIDLPLVLAIATRESGASLPLATGNRRLVSAGRDAHTRGESGLDWLHTYRRFFPREIRNQILRVRDNNNVPGDFKEGKTNQEPAYIRERDVLASFIVEIKQRERRFIRIFNRRFNTEHGFSAEQRTQLLSQLTRESRRAWIQAAFGSRLSDLLENVRNKIRNEMNAGTSFATIMSNNNINLNSIITNDELMGTNLSRQRTRISAAEAGIVESFLPENL